MDGTALQYALLLLATVPPHCQSIKVLKIADINTRSNSAAEVLGSDVDKVSCDWWRAGHVTTCHVPGPRGQARGLHRQQTVALPRLAQHLQVTIQPYCRCARVLQFWQQCRMCIDKHNIQRSVPSVQIAFSLKILLKLFVIGVETQSLFHMEFLHLPTKIFIDWRFLKNLWLWFSCSISSQSIYLAVHIGRVLMRGCV